MHANARRNKKNKQNKQNKPKQTNNPSYVVAGHQQIIES